MADIQEMRHYVSAIYSGQAWKDRVRKMRDEQVIAIYFSKKRGEETLNKQQELKESKPDDPLTLF